jgi:hypothetical protein
MKGNADESKLVTERTAKRQGSAESSQFQSILTISLVMERQLTWAGFVFRFQCEGIKFGIFDTVLVTRRRGLVERLRDGKIKCHGDETTPRPDLF